jgi:crotonobetainyl-CoA:carnitine CoA-transferase CaiB-like acyl-CoA transferase
VLDLSRLIPGPLCTLILAELGAEVIKVEDTGGGDYLRLIPPLREGIGGAFYALNRGKRSLSIDLKKPEGRAALLRLLGSPGTRVVVESFRPGVMARLGLDFAMLRQHQPELILCSISGYGQDGPLAGRAGHDIDYLALSGVLAAGGEAGGSPALPGVQIADLAGGALWATIRILAALRSPEPAHLDVSMTEGALALLLPWFGDLCFGSPPLRRGEATLNGGAASYGVYRAGDGGHLAVGSLEPKFWSGLRSSLGLPVEMAALVAPPARQRELRAEIAARLESAPRDAWAEKLAAADCCCEPVLEMEEVAEHPQHRARGVFRTLEDPARGPIRLPRLPLDDQLATGPAPRLGEQSDEILAAAGLSLEEIAELRGIGAIR